MADSLIGHNSSLKSYVDRMVSLAEERERLAEDIRQLKSEAKEHEIDPTALASIVKIRMEDEKKRKKRIAKQEVLDSYMVMLGMLE